MKISIVTLFPEMFSGPFEYSILKRAKDAKKISIEFINIRDFGIGKHKIVDDKPYGGGAGMILRIDVIEKAIKSAKCDLKIKGKKCKEKIILLDPKGQLLDQEKVRNLASLDHLILICGHYEGIDERVRKAVDEEISIGDYILTGGELPAMIITDAVSRLISGVLKKKIATDEESFSQAESLLEYPQYTRPEAFQGEKVPSILLSGDHKKILEWKKNEALKLTKKKRPDLLKKTI